MVLIDPDGAGPERIQIENPELGAAYRIGVHYWNHHGWGPSYATVRVWLDGNLLYETQTVELAPQDMWFVGTLKISEGTWMNATKDSGGHHITPHYEHPLFLGE
jgi:hypothetical protein